MAVILLGRSARQIGTRNVLDRLDFRVVEQARADVDDAVADGILLGQPVGDFAASLLDNSKRGLRLHTGNVRNGDKNVRVIPAGERRVAFALHRAVKRVEDIVAHLVAVGVVDKVEILNVVHKQQVGAVAAEQRAQFCRENVLRNDRNRVSAVGRERHPVVRAALLFAALVQIHVAVCGTEQIVNEEIMVLVADLPADCVADREVRRAVVLLDQLTQLQLHRFQLVRRGVLLHDDKFIAAEPREKAVFGQNAGQAGRKGLDEEIAFFVPVIVVDPFQSVQIEHHNADIQRVASLLQLQQILLKRFLIAHAGHIGKRLDRNIVDVAAQTQLHSHRTGQQEQLRQQRVMHQMAR